MDVGLRVAKKEEAEGPWSLPDHWSWTRITRVAAVNPTTNFDTLDPTSEIPFVPMASVAEETGKIDLSARRPLRDVAKGYVRFMEGDVIFAKITPCMENGKVAPIIGLPGGFAAGSTEFHVFRPEAVDQKYLWYWLVSRGFRGRARRIMSGSAGQLRVPVDWLREAAFPLAPLAEQRRIVARIDALFAEIAEGEAALAEARKGLDIFRRALLKAAVTGELTKDWREKNPVSETGDDLLTSSATQPTMEIGSGRHRSREVGQLDRKIFPSLPPGWAWCALGELILEIQAGLNVAAQGRPPHTGEIGIVKVSAVTWGEFDENASKTLLPTAKIDERNIIQPGDFLFSRANTLELVGAPVIVKTITKRLVLSDKILRFRLADPTKGPWIEIFLKSAYGRKQIEAAATGAQLSMRNISQENIRKIAVPIPPASETAEIVSRVSTALEACAETLTSLQAEAADADRVKQSILKAAFEGRLVPQDPTDEPASALLARLAASRTHTPAKRGRVTREGQRS